MILTRHDSTLELRVQDAYELMLSLPENSVDLVLTDPPYGISKAQWDCELDYAKFWQAIHHCAKQTAAILVFGSNNFTVKLAASNLKECRYRFVWDKSGGLTTGAFNSHRMPLSAFEDIVVFYRKLPTYNYQDCMRQGFKPYVRKAYNRYVAETNGGSSYGTCKFKPCAKSINGERFPINVLKFNKDLRMHGKHATSKPTALLEYLIRMYSNAGELVLDPFLGSGSTALACVNTGRNFVGGDLNESFVQTAIERLPVNAELGIC